MRYPPGHFRIVSTLTKESFDYHPLWSEYYDFEERDEIVSWGIDRAWLDAVLNEMDHSKGHDHPYYTALVTSPIPLRMRIYIKARFETPHGRSLEGFVVNEEAYAVCIFIAGEEFWLNATMGADHWTEKTLRDMRKALDDESDPIVPLRYGTDFRDGDGRLIEGVFAFSE